MILGVALILFLLFLKSVFDTFFEWCSHCWKPFIMTETGMINTFHGSFFSKCTKTFKEKEGILEKNCN